MKYIVGLFAAALILAVSMFLAAQGGLDYVQEQVQVNGTHHGLTILGLFSVAAILVVLALWMTVIVAVVFIRDGEASVKIHDQAKPSPQSR